MLMLLLFAPQPQSSLNTSYHLSTSYF